MTESDSKHWNWGSGFCTKHPGNGVPCKACIATLDPALIREDVVEAMMTTWERGEVYTMPYTAAEPREAARRWNAEGRMCPPPPR